MSYGRNIVYTFDGSFDGLMTAVFWSYSRHETPTGVEPEGTYQLGLDQTEREIVTDISLSGRVQAGIRKKLGEHILQKLYYAFASQDPERFVKIYRYLVLGFEMGRRVENHLQDDRVLEIEKIVRFVLNERHYTIEFLRFSVLEGGIQYAEISPKNNQVAFVMPHFCDRFPDIPFIIFDRIRGLAGVYDRDGWILVETDGINLPELSSDERMFRRLWKKFYDTIAVEMRINPKLRKGNMPMRYWRHMIEMKMSPVEEGSEEIVIGTEKTKTHKTALKIENK